jgi:DNA-binding FadR family transcriptional regulator
MHGMHGRVVEWLGSRIATGQLSGTLDLDQIARQFQVSRSLVRECVRTLAAKGIVRARQRAGTLVTPPEQWALLDEQVIRWRAAGPRRFVQLRESLELRMKIEPLAARLTAQRNDDATIQVLRTSVDRIGQAVAADDGNLMISADTSFHRALYIGSDNSMLAGLAGTVHACLRVPDFQDYRRFSPDSTARHRHLVEVISSGDGDAAEQAAAAMMERSAQLFRAAYEQVLSGHALHSSPRTAQNG